MDFPLVESVELRTHAVLRLGIPARLPTQPEEQAGEGM